MVHERWQTNQLLERKTCQKTGQENNNNNNNNVKKCNYYCYDTELQASFFLLSHFSISDSPKMEGSSPPLSLFYSCTLFILKTRTRRDWEGPPLPPSASRPITSETPQASAPPSSKKPSKPRLRKPSGSQTHLVCRH